MESTLTKAVGLYACSIVVFQRNFPTCPYSCGTLNHAWNPKQQACTEIKHENCTGRMFLAKRGPGYLALNSFWSTILLGFLGQKSFFTVCLWELEMRNQESPAIQPGPIMCVFAPIKSQDLCLFDQNQKNSSGGTSPGWIEGCVWL
jgi:hypothetical protein